MTRFDNYFRTSHQLGGRAGGRVEACRRRFNPRTEGACREGMRRQSSGAVRGRPSPPLRFVVRPAAPARRGHRPLPPPAASPVRSRAKSGRDRTRARRPRTKRALRCWAIRTPQAGQRSSVALLARRPSLPRASGGAGPRPRESRPFSWRSNDDRTSSTRAVATDAGREARCCFSARRS